MVLVGQSGRLLRLFPCLRRMLWWPPLFLSWCCLLSLLGLLRLLLSWCCLLSLLWRLRLLLLLLCLCLWAACGVAG